ncbi:TetR/AcrR family transcriptional regulator [Undibacter mobilis]|uniref:TetR/AcrR family transcriptional regulator n=1 Tax=Undibacter mobilis TaxID=2292256 RepID=A0A371B2R1_9BRAD|nr:TetR/AcrR family transcriptional regulator [Undibacter mobilis]RDV01876.1 TetR/AcrR family transcriptional regulator [Undibacter mobilis]
MTALTTREQIVTTADRLFYENGYEHTSFADIAAAVNISRGNFYYHFKAKDEILTAVIAARLAHTKTMIEGWEREAPNPEARIRRFMHMMIANRAAIKRYGCPVGTLVTEMAKLDHVAREDANKLFGLFRAWLGTQFRALGCGADADRLAMHLLARSQGVATLANAFGDDRFIRREVALMEEWLTAAVAHATPRPDNRRRQH